MDYLSYLPLVPIVVLILDVVIIVGLRLFRPRFTHSWLIAVLGALIAWTVVLFTRSDRPIIVNLFQWEPAELFSVSPFLVVDQISWSYALALATIALAILLTDVMRAAEADWVSSTSILLQAALGLFAVQSGNLLTLLLAWTTIDVLEVVILLSLIPQSTGRERVVMLFSARLAGSIVLVWTLIYAASLGSTNDFGSLVPQISPYLVLAACLRLGGVTIRQPFLRESQTRRNLGTMSRLVGMAVSLVLLTHTAVLGVSGAFGSILIALAGLVGLYAAITWAASGEEIEGRPYWILSISSLAVATTVEGEPMSTLAWGIGGLLPGALLFLASARQRYITIILSMGMIGISCLPYSPTWQAAYLYATPIRPWMVIFLLMQIIILGGYARHAYRQEPTPAGIERWVWVVYPWGLGLLVLGDFLIGWFIRPAQIELGNVWPGVITSAGLGLLIFARQRIRASTVLTGVTARIGSAISSLFSLEWLFPIIWRLYFSIGRSLSFVSVIFEGDGGVLWAFLILVLMVAIMAQLRMGI